MIFKRVVHKVVVLVFDTQLLSCPVLFLAVKAFVLVLCSCPLSFRSCPLPQVPVNVIDVYYSQMFVVTKTVGPLVSLFLATYRTKTIYSFAA